MIGCVLLLRSWSTIFVGYCSGCTFESFETYSHFSVLFANNGINRAIPLVLAFLIILWALYDGIMFIVMWVRERKKQNQQTTIEEESNPNTDA